MSSIKDEFAKDVVKAFVTDYKTKNNDKYEFNMDKCDKMNDIIAYCRKLETECDCKIIRCMLEPKHEQGYVQVLFSGEFMLGDKETNLQEFVDALKLCDGINIVTNPVGSDLFQITFFVENLWIPKN